MSDTRSPAMSEALQVRRRCVVLKCRYHHLRAIKLGHTILSIILLLGGLPDTVRIIIIRNTRTRCGDLLEGGDTM